jgi:hypothetical protein
VDGRFLRPSRLLLCLLLFDCCVLLVDAARYAPKEGDEGRIGRLGLVWGAFSKAS